MLPKNTGLEEYAALVGEMSNKRISVRGEDVPFFVDKLLKKGVECVGVTGEDLLAEYKLRNPINNITALEKIAWVGTDALFGKPTLCLLGPKGERRNILDTFSTIVINKKYKSIAENYLGKLAQRGAKFEKIFLSGATEEAAQLDLADYVIDIVYSGFSASNAGLRVYDRIFESDVVLIGARGEQND